MVALAAGILSSPKIVSAQLTTTDILLAPKVCPLSEAQTQNSIEAFAKMVPTFHHKRCANCHGGVNPFTGANHGGGKIDVTEDQMDQGACNVCHDKLPPLRSGKTPVWKLPVLPDHSFVNKDAKTLCEMMKKAFNAFPHPGTQFEFHILEDNGKTDFQMIAFAGTRGVSDRPPEPIEGLTLGGFFDQAIAWVDAMGGEFKGDERCGCEPLQFAIRIKYVAASNLLGGIVQEMAQMGPVDIPIRFHEGGTYEGQGMLPFAARGTVTATPTYCASQSQAGMQVKVSGKAIEEPEKHQMHIELTNLTRNNGATAQECNVPYGSGVFALNGGDKATIRFDVIGRVGDLGATPFPLPTPFVKAVVSVQVVDQSAQPATAH